MTPNRVWCAAYSYMDLSVYTQVDLASIRGGVSVISQRLPSAPGIYAFFRRAQPLSLDSPDQFFADLMALVECPAAPRHTTTVGPLHNVSLESRSSLSPRKRDKLRELSSTSDFRVRISQVVAAASDLQSPLYVGKTVCIQDRIAQHLDPMSPLASRLREVGLEITQCRLAYTLIEGGSEYFSNDTLTLIEEIVTRYLRPGFVLRAG